MNLLPSLRTIWLLLLLHVSYTAVAQQSPTRLDQDPVFLTVAAKRIIYPIGAASRSVYGRLFATFDVTATGDIKNIAVIYTIMDAYTSRHLGFDYEITNGLKHMPRLKPTYAGNYLLPIAFVYTNFSERSEAFVPTNQLPSTYTPGTTTIILNEIKIFGQNNAYPSPRMSLSKIAPPSQQIVP